MLGLGTGPAADLAVPLDRDELIAYGPRLSENGATRDVGVDPEDEPGHGTRHPDLGPARLPWVRNWQFGRRL